MTSKNNSKIKQATLSDEHRYKNSQTILTNGIYHVLKWSYTTIDVELSMNTKVAQHLQIHHHINKVNDKNNISIDQRKPLTQFNIYLWLKKNNNFQQIWYKGLYLNIIKAHT